eukprot:GFUD01102916.1.p1 GENE.GFUD01102916.1~~GFUD01102916.1.p1  ORF type:complete len:106 (+),score=25.31 GFUD01102916.1:36-353(+)
MSGPAKKINGREQDPSPSDFFWPSMDIDKSNQQINYDSKKTVWVPCPETGVYCEGLLESGDLEDPASECVVIVGNMKFSYDSAVVGRINPPDFELGKLGLWRFIN